MTSQDDASSGMNDSGTGSESGTKLTQERSGFDLENARRDLIAKRNAAGADTEIGHRCSNLIEQLENYRTAEGDQRANLAKSIERTLKELAIRHQ